VFDELDLDIGEEVLGAVKDEVAGLSCHRAARTGYFAAFVDEVAECWRCPVSSR
jgi:hypothetical protein